MSERVLRTFDASGFVLTEKTFPARGRLAEHAHQNAHFCFVVEGHYTESHQRHTLDCAPSTLTFRPAGEAHRNEFHDEPMVFRRHFHCTVGEYVRGRRIEYACRQLARSRTPLAIIALDAGFANQGHFSTAFKRMTGFTPAAYRADRRRPGG